ncbi:MAG: hypothetical protein HKN33_10710 [Pyrinomonadaceae bacterium]|nr:hypothetical protein [Pyrinomonadaceae bacterium]
MNKGKETLRGTITEKALERLIAEAQHAEKSRDSERMRKSLNAIWPDLEVEPNIPETDSKTAAELLRLCGFFIGYHGHLTNKRDYQERGKDLLSRSIDLFESEGMTEEATGARINLAWRYQQQGAFEEAAVILDYTKATFKGRKTHPLYLSIEMCEIVAEIARGNVKEAIRKIRRIEKAVIESGDEVLKSQFHNEAGFAFAEQGDLVTAESHHRRAAESGKAMGNERFEAISTGNLAFVLKEQRDFEAASAEIEKAIGLNRKGGHDGFLAHNFDTRAQIYFDQGDYGRALLAIENALEIFVMGDDFAGLTEAKLNKSKILFKLGEVSESLLLFADTVSIVKAKVSEAAALRYAEDYSSLFYVHAESGYKKEVAQFRKHILRDALTKSGLVFKTAAETLDISQAMLSDIVRRQFPELFDELGIKKRKSRKV